MVKIGEERAERLDIVPARFQVIVTVRPCYACHRCDAGVIQADTPNWLIEGGLPTEGTLARVAVSKYVDQLPLYNNIGPHLSLGNKTPAEARQAFELLDCTAPGALATTETDDYQTEGLSL